MPFEYDPKEICDFCRAPYAFDYKQIIQLRCRCKGGKLMHKSCFDSWSKSRQTCPTCNHKLPGGEAAYRLYPDEQVVLAGMLVHIGFIDSFRAALALLSRYKMDNLDDLFMTLFYPERHYEFSQFLSLFHHNADGIRLKNLKLENLRNVALTLLHICIAQCYKMHSIVSSEQQPIVSNHILQCLGVIHSGASHLLPRWQIMNHDFLIHLGRALKSDLTTKSEHKNIVGVVNKFNHQSVDGLPDWLTAKLSEYDLKDYVPLLRQLLALPIKKEYVDTIADNSDEIIEIGEVAERIPNSITATNNRSLRCDLIAMIILVMLFVIVFIVLPNHTSLGPRMNAAFDEFLSYRFVGFFTKQMLATTKYLFTLLDKGAQTNYTIVNIIYYLVMLIAFSIAQAISFGTFVVEAFIYIICFFSIIVYIFTKLFTPEQHSTWKQMLSSRSQNGPVEL